MPDFSTRSTKQVENISSALLDWFYKNHRILPFRTDPSPYHVWLSDLMLQEYRGSAALAYYARFLAGLPVIPALAACEEEKLHKLWEGLGYYSRVRNLQKAARIVCEQYGGQLPADYDALRALPGIGDYTAGAVASISFGIPVPAVDGKPYALDADGNCWRVYPFIERARTYDQIETTKQCVEAARAFGDFQKLTADLPGEPLFETIPNFHNTTSRLAALKDAIQADPLGRVKEVQKEIDWYLSREADCHLVVDYLKSGELPLRCTHNDTKLNNVMLDDVTGEGICVIDLDTTMPGSAIYDFGDMIRTATSPAAEDEKDISKVTMRMFMFEALVQGYVSSAKSFLTPLEKSLLPFSGKLLTMECGIRFLTDYLSGDVYFKIHRPEHNLDRCRTQMALVESIEAQMDEMKAVVDRY